MRRCDLFEKVRVELGEMARLPVLDDGTRWSSTFVMIKIAFSARRVFNTVCNRVSGSDEVKIREGDCERAANICNFLETAASVTELQSGSFI